MTNAIYHVCRRDEWQTAQASGAYPGSSQDKADGFIHFSGAEQVVASVAKSRAGTSLGGVAKWRPGQSGLVTLEADPAILGPALKWEPSRDNKLFPHLYGAL